MYVLKCLGEGQRKQDIVNTLRTVTVTTRTGLWATPPTHVALA
jgi:hypothetical protein